MTQSKYWRFDINNQNRTSGSSGTAGSSSSSSSSSSGQNQTGQAFLIIESNDQQSAMQQAKQLLGNQQSQNLTTPTQVDESTVEQITNQTTTV